MEKLFGEIVEGSRSMLPECSAIPLPDEFSEQSSRSIRFQAKFFSTRFGDMRTVYIEGPKIEIVNLFFFPVEAVHAPVYAMEFVQMGRRAVVGVIDVVADPTQNLSVEEARSLISPIRDKYTDLKQGQDPPDWFQECRSGSDFFVRPESADQLEQLNRAHFQVLESYLNSIHKDGEHSIDPKEYKKWQAHYKHHHAENSPGLPFLNRTFGEEWSFQFLHQYLFS